MRMRITLLTMSAFVTVFGTGCAATAQPDQSVTGVRGNWIKKNAWMKEAQALQKQIIEDSGVVKKSRTQFSDEFDKIDKKVDSFYSSKGFERGKIGSLVEDIKNDIAADKAKRIAVARKRSENEDAPINFYDVHVEAIEQEVKRFERDFEQFNLDMKSIADLDASLVERMKIVDKQIKDANGIVDQSSKKLDEMWWIIDDQKAADVFFLIQDFAEKMTAIKKYLNDTLIADFKKVIQTLEKQIDQVNKEATAIEERGFVVSHRAQRMEKKPTHDGGIESSTDAHEDDQDTVREDRPARRRRPAVVRKEGILEYCKDISAAVYAILSDAVTQAFDFFLSFSRSFKKRRAPAARPAESE